MILLGGFYTILTTTTEENKINAVLKLNPEHEIFKGHFPGQPVVPGVCMLQIIQELIEIIIGKKNRLSKGHELKFLAIIDPEKYNLINIEINYSKEVNNDMNVSARLFYNEITFFKCKGIFIADN